MKSISPIRYGKDAVGSNKTLRRGSPDMNLNVRAFLFGWEDEDIHGAHEEARCEVRRLTTG